MMPGIYQILYKNSGKRYIGSSKNIFSRWREHKNSFFKNNNSKYLQNAWNKYGSDSFIFEVIEYCNLDILLQREQY